MKEADKYQEYFLAALKYYIEKEGYGSQSPLAADAKISDSMLSQVKAGFRKFSFRKMIAISRSLGHSIEDFWKIGRNIIEGNSPEIMTDFTEEETARNKLSAHVQDRTDLMLEYMVKCIDKLDRIAENIEGIRKDFKKDSDPLAGVGGRAKKEGS